MRKKKLFRPFSFLNSGLLKGPTLISFTLAAVLAGYGLYAVINELPKFAVAHMQDHLNCKACFSSIHDCLTEVIEAIHKAEKSIQVQTYSFTSQEVANALIKVHQRGVKVTILTDKSPKTHPHTQLQDLRKEGIEIFYDSHLPISHSKILIIDDKIVMAGSYHFTNEEEQLNAENLLIIADKEIAEQYSREFNRRLGVSRSN